MIHAVPIALILINISICYCDSFSSEKKNSRFVTSVQKHGDVKLCDHNDGLGPSKLLNQRCLIKSADDSCKNFVVDRNVSNCEQMKYVLMYILYIIHTLHI